MALTATLDDVRGIGNPVSPPAGGGFLQGLTQFATRGLSSLASYQANADKKESEAALNDAAQGVQDRFKQGTAYMNPVMPQENGEPVPPDVVAGAQKLGVAQKAVANGSMPQSAMDLHLETLVDDLYAKHPEKKAQIATYLASQGYDHYLFRDYKASVAAQDNAVKTKQEAEDFSYNAAAHAGLINPATATREEGILAGQQYLQLQAQLAQGKTALEMANTQSQIDERTRTAAAAQGAKDIVGAIIGDANLRTNALVNGLSAMTQEALSDPTGKKYNDLKEALPQINVGIQTAKSAAIAQVYKAGGGKTEADAVSAYYDQMAEGITRVWTGELSKDNLNKGILEGMQTQLGIQAAQAFPLWNQLAKLPGMANALPLLFGGDPAHALSKEQQDAIKKELSGWAPGSTEGLYRIQRIADVLRGDLKLTNLSLSDAQKTIAGVNSAVVGNGAAILAGDKTLATTKPFLTGLEQLSDAAFTLSPGTDASSQFRASQLLSTKETVNGLLALAKDPAHKDEAEQVVYSLRGTAQKGIITAKSGDWEHGNPGSMQKLVFDPRTQTVQRVLDEAAYKNYVATVTKQNRQPAYTARQSDTNAQQVRVMTRDEVMSHADSLLDKRAGTINNYLNTMVRTYPADPNVPKGLTPRQVREAAFLGVPVDQVADGPKNDFPQRLQALEAQARNLTFNTIDNSAKDANASLAMNYFTGAGWSKAAASGIVGNLMAESGLNPSNTGGDGGTSHGLAQWRQERLSALHAFAQQRGAKWDDLNTQLAFVQHELQTSHSQAATALKNATTAEQAAEAFALYFEKPKGSETGNASNIVGMDKRASNAARLFGNG